MATIDPSYVIQDTSSNVVYSNPDVLFLPNFQFVLRNSSNIYVSDTTTTSNIISNTVANNFNYPTQYSNASSSCLYTPSGIYTSMEASPISGNGFIQLTSNGVSSNYFQFNSSQGTPSPGQPLQYPTGLNMDTSGNLYFLVFGDNYVYKITNLSDPSNNYSRYNSTSTISAPFDSTIITNNNGYLNYIYLTATNYPYYIEQIDTNGNATNIPNYTANQASYGICSDGSNNLYIGYANGVIGKYNLTTSTFTQNFVTLSGEGDVYGLTYILQKNAIIANTASTNIYAINTLGEHIIIINSSGILGGFGTDNINSIYGTTGTQIIQYVFQSSITFNNLNLTSTGINPLNIYNITASSVLGDSINVTVESPQASCGYSYNNNDLINIFQPISLGQPSQIVTQYKVGNNDLNTYFASLASGIPLGYNVGYQVGGSDLSQIFAKNNPQVYITTNETANLQITKIINNGYTGLIFENTTTPYTGQNYNAGCTITFLVNKTVSFLVVGGGGGGGCGNYGCGGGGGGGSSYIYQDSLSITANTEFSLIVSFGGLGRQVSNGGQGNSTGNTGSYSYITSSTINLTASGGAGGKGIGTAQGYAGGPGGSAVNNINNTSGGGGGSGGGASENPVGAASNAGPAGYLNNTYNYGNLGGTGNTSTGGTGGNCYNSTSVSLPFTSSSSTVYFGNGGGGGASSTGGQAGNSTGGAGSGATNTNGQNATIGLNGGNYYYGNGGGGGSQSASQGNYGGNGSNGVVILWYQN